MKSIFFEFNNLFKKYFLSNPEHRTKNMKKLICPYISFSMAKSSN